MPKVRLKKSFSFNYNLRTFLKLFTNQSEVSALLPVGCVGFNAGVQNCAIATTTLNPTLSISCTRNRSVWIALMGKDAFLSSIFQVLSSQINYLKWNRGETLIFRRGRGGGSANPPGEGANM